MKHNIVHRSIKKKHETESGIGFPVKTSRGKFPEDKHA